MTISNPQAICPWGRKRRFRTVLDRLASRRSRRSNVYDRKLKRRRRVSQNPILTTKTPFCRDAEPNHGRRRRSRQTRWWCTLVEGSNDHEGLFTLRSLKLLKHATCMRGQSVSRHVRTCPCVSCPLGGCVIHSRRAFVKNTQHPEMQAVYTLDARLWNSPWQCATESTRTARTRHSPAQLQESGTTEELYCDLVRPELSKA